MVERRRRDVVVSGRTPPHSHDAATEQALGGIGVERLRRAGPGTEPGDEPPPLGHPVVQGLPGPRRQRRRIDEHDPPGVGPRRIVELVDRDGLKVEAGLPQPRRRDRLRDEEPRAGRRLRGRHDHPRRRPDRHGEGADVVGIEIIGALDHHPTLPGADLQPLDVEIDLRGIPLPPRHILRAAPGVAAIRHQQLHRHRPVGVGAGTGDRGGERQRRARRQLVGGEHDLVDGEVLRMDGGDVDDEHARAGMGGHVERRGVVPGAVRAVGEHVDLPPRPVGTGQQLQAFGDRRGQRQDGRGRGEPVEPAAGRRRRGSEGRGAAGRVEHGHRAAVGKLVEQHLGHRGRLLEPRLVRLAQQHPRRGVEDERRRHRPLAVGQPAGTADQGPGQGPGQKRQRRHPQQEQEQVVEL